MSTDEHVQHLLEETRKLYKLQDQVKAWKEELEPLEEILTFVVQDLEQRNIHMEEGVAIGATGIVYKASDTSLERDRAVKIPRPRFGAGNELVQVILAETEKLKRLEHPNIVRLHYWGTVSVKGIDMGYAVMDFIDFGTARTHFSKPQPMRALAQFIVGVLCGLSYLHQNHIYHMDLKPDNILLGAGNEPRITDLASSKFFAPVTGLTTVVTTPQYAHPELLDAITEAISSAAGLATIDRADLRPAFDLYAFGRTILDLLSNIAQPVNAEDVYLKCYISLLAARLLDGQEDETERYGELSHEHMEEIKYETAEEAYEDARRMLRRVSLEQLMPELDPTVGSYVQLSKGDRAPYTQRLRDIMEHDLFTRLECIKQLGLLHYVYPGARHTRWEHALGTFAITGLYVRSLFYDAREPLFRSIMSAEDIRAVLLAALLHDIGQYPLAHDFEELSNKFAHEHVTVFLLGGKLPPETDLEERAKARLRESLNVASLQKCITDDWGCNPTRLIEILTGESNDTLRIGILHSIVSGPIDADRLDYLMFDAVHLGVPYGTALDSERLIRCLTTIYGRAEGEAQETGRIGITEKGLISAEGLAATRYAMYRAAYWHKTYRAIKAMVKWMVVQTFDLRYAKKFRSAWGDFLEEVVCGTRPGAGQPRLALIEPTMCPRLGKEGEVLMWLANAGPSGVGAMAKMLCKRHLYKGVLGVSRARHESLHIWLTEDYTRLGPIGQQRVQKALEDEFVGSLPAKVSDTVSTIQEEGLPVVLVDVPQRRNGDETERLYFRQPDGQEAGSVEKSMMWDELSQLHRVACTPRVFVHVWPPSVDLKKPRSPPVLHKGPWAAT